MVDTFWRVGGQCALSAYNAEWRKCGLDLWPSVLPVVDKRCCLPYQQTKDVGAIKPTAAAITHTQRTVHPEGIQDGAKQDTGSKS